MITLEGVKALPQTYTQDIPTDYLDEMGHMNIQWYMHLFDRAAWGAFRLFGIDAEMMQAARSGVFALEHHIRYLAEVRAGDAVAIHTRYLSYSDKRLLFMHFMVNETQNKLAATLEALAIHIDMGTRRSAPWPNTISQQLGAVVADHAGLTWDAPLSGVLQA